MQLRGDDSFWHKRAIGGFKTACGQVIQHRFKQELRHESYEGKLCRNGCFSTYELHECESAEIDRLAGR